MSNEFIREARYVVLKNADIMQCLTVNELIELRRIQAKVEDHRAEIGKSPLDCVVVESDWPEYEPTWKAIEARVTGAQPAPSVPDGWKLVPIKPTPVMKTAGIGVEVYQDLPPSTDCLTWEEVEAIYTAMIEVAPEAKP